jgi:threonine dehydratase
LQEIGSFKLRGAGNAILQADPSELKKGIVTASAGNMAQVRKNEIVLEIPMATL